MQLHYIGEPTKQLVLFNYQWFDCERNHGIKVHKEYDIVKAHHHKRYLNYDPFILVANAIKVYYMSSPKKIKEKVDWWVGIKTKARSMVDNQYTQRLHIKMAFLVLNLCQMVSYLVN